MLLLNKIVSKPVPYLMSVSVVLLLIFTSATVFGQSRPVTLRVQTSIDFFNDDPNDSELAYRAAHEAFLAENPNIRIEFEIVPPFELYRQFLVAAEGRNAPDITYQGAANTYTLASSGNVLALNDYMDGHPFLNPDNLQSAILDVATVDGQYYVIPTTTDARVLYYRKDLFEAAGLDASAPPTTRAELIETAQSLTQDTDGDGETDQWGYCFIADNTLHTPHMWLTHVWAAGGDLVDADGKAVYDSEAGIAAAQFYYDLVNTYEVTPSNIIANDYDATVRALVSGQCAMALLGTWSWPVDILGALGEENVGWTPVPTPEGGEAATFSGGWSWLISSRSDHPDEAWAYIEAIASEELALELGRENISTRQSVLSSPEIQDTFVANVGTYAAGAAHGNPQVTSTQPLFDGLRQALQDVIRGRQDAQTALTQAAETYNSRYAR
ncbi:MAG: sugar ABC transporter substrate-binding protein [Deinococcota bacterium]